ncbi:MAG: hypothetical protein K0U41_09290 [Gammaproteobacteria bacterium]|nr:hypothetical protein [Gammaproteobacteria bacterium]
MGNIKLFKSLLRYLSQDNGTGIVAGSAGSRHCIIMLVIILAGGLIGCANSFEKPYLIKDKGPIYIGVNGKDEYHFSLMVTRQIYRHQTDTTEDLTAARTIVQINGPKCNRFVIFTDSLGQRRDYFIKCDLDYEVKSGISEEEDITSDKPQRPVTATLVATSLLTRTDSVSGYFRKEAEIERELYEDLAQQLVLALATISL